jgi:hypothetical protein
MPLWQRMMMLVTRESPAQYAPLGLSAGQVKIPEVELLQELVLIQHRRSRGGD